MSECDKSISTKQVLQVTDYGMSVPDDAVHIGPIERIVRSIPPTSKCGLNLMIHFVDIATGWYSSRLPA